MKVIDLLNKIANGEEVPNYIQYYNCKTNKNEIMMVCELNIIYKLNHEEMFLNDEIEETEIIEEDKPIEKIRQFCEYLCSDGYECWSIKEDILVNKINEIIDKVNELESE